MNQNATSIPTVSLRIRLSRGVRQSSKLGSHKVSAAQAGRPITARHSVRSPTLNILRIFRVPATRVRHGRTHFGVLNHGKRGAEVVAVGEGIFLAKNQPAGRKPNSR